MKLEKGLEFARWLLISVLSIKAGEAYSGQRILPQNPLDVNTLLNNLMNLDLTTITIILGVFLFFVLIIVAIKKKRSQARVREIIYVPVESLKR